MFPLARTAFAAAGAVVVTIGIPVRVVPVCVAVPFAAFAWLAVVAAAVAGTVSELQ